MPRSTTLAVINQAHFRVRRAEEAMTQALDLLRAAAARPGCGELDLSYVEKVKDLVGLTRAAVAEWGAEAAAHRKLHSAALQAIAAMRPGRPPPAA